MIPIVMRSRPFWALFQSSTAIVCQQENHLHSEMDGLRSKERKVKVNSTPALNRIGKVVLSRLTRKTHQRIERGTGSGTVQGE